VIELGDILEKGSTTVPPPPESELALEELEEEVDEPLEPAEDVDPEFCALSAAVEFGATIGICTGAVCVPSDFVRDRVTSCDDEVMCYPRGIVTVWTPG
jgi:hypothetical protein